MNAPLSHLFSTLLSRVTNWQCSPRTCTIQSEWLPHPCLLGGPNKGDKNKALKKQKNKKFPMVSLTLPIVRHIAPTGVWAQDHSVAEALLYPLGYGPSLTHLCTGVVFIFGPIWFSSIIGFSSKN